jgi:hypothetical protein
MDRIDTPLAAALIAATVALAVAAANAIGAWHSRRAADRDQFWTRLTWCIEHASGDREYEIPTALLREFSNLRWIGDGDQRSLEVARRHIERRVRPEQESVNERINHGDDQVR